MQVQCFREICHHFIIWFDLRVRVNNLAWQKYKSVVIVSVPCPESVSVEFRTGHLGDGDFVTVCRVEGLACASVSLNKGPQINGISPCIWLLVGSEYEQCMQRQNTLQKNQWEVIQFCHGESYDRMTVILSHKCHINTNCIS